MSGRRVSGKRKSGSLSCFNRGAQLIARRRFYIRGATRPTNNRSFAAGRQRFAVNPIEHGNHIVASPDEKVVVGVDAETGAVTVDIVAAPAEPSPKSRFRLRYRPAWLARRCGIDVNH